MKKLPFLFVLGVLFVSCAHTDTEQRSVADSAGCPLNDTLGACADSNAERHSVADTTWCYPLDASLSDTEQRLVAYSAWCYPLNDTHEACITFNADHSFQEELRQAGSQDGVVYGTISGEWSLAKACGKAVITQRYRLASLLSSVDSLSVRAYYERENRRLLEAQQQHILYGIGPFSGFTPDGHIRLDDGTVFWSYGEEMSADYNLNYFSTRSFAPSEE